MKRLLRDPGSPGPLRDLGLLGLRVAFAASLIGAHGWGKLVRLVEGSARFPDPFGLGPTASLALAVFAEVVCSALLMLGIGGRLPAAVLGIFFVVAFFVVHGGEPFGDREMAFLYLAAFVVLALTGPGRYSLGRLARSR